MKQIEYIGSILGNTNKIVSDAWADWRGIREGCYIKFIGHEAYYIVSKLEKFTYIKDFENIDNTKLRIKDNVGINLSKNDEIVISYKEYELYTIINIINGGQNYKSGDILTPKGGVVSFDIITGQYFYPKFQVTEVKPGGVISKLQLNDKGKYIIVPDNVIELSGGMGNSAKLEVQYTLLDKRAMVEKEIEKLETNNETIVHLNYPVPEGVKTGKISVEKYEIMLNSNYSGKDLHNIGLDVIRDFSLNYRLPFLKDNSFSNKAIFNEVITKQDKIIKQLEDRIEKLEQKN